MTRKKREAAPTPSAAGKADPEQSARFIEMARELGCEENFHLLDEALRAARTRSSHEKPIPPPAATQRRTETEEE